MKTIVFASLKGGVGKSTSALSTAHQLSKTGRTILIDADHRSATSSHFFDDLDVVNNRTIHQALLSERPIEECIHHYSETLHVIPSEIELGLIELELAAHPNRNMILFELLQEIADDYDYCVIDTPNDIGTMANSAVIAADVVIFPTQAEKWGARAINMTLKGFEPCRKVGRYTGKQFIPLILITGYEENRSIQMVMKDLIRETYPDMVCNTVIHRSSALQAAYAQTGRFLMEGSRPFKEYSAFLAEIWG